MKQNWLFWLIFFITLLFFCSTITTAADIECESFDGGMTIEYDLETVKNIKFKEKKKKPCKNECSMFLCYDKRTNGYVYGAGCIYDVLGFCGNKQNLEIANEIKTSTIFYINPTVAYFKCKESSCHNGFNEGLKTQSEKTPNMKFGEKYSLKDIKLHKPQSTPKPASRKETTTKSSTLPPFTSTSKPAEKSSPSLIQKTTKKIITNPPTLPPNKPITKSNVVDTTIWHTECTEGKCKEGLAVIEEKENSSFGTKINYFVLIIWGMILITFVVFV